VPPDEQHSEVGQHAGHQGIRGLRLAIAPEGSTQTSTVSPADASLLTITSPVRAARHRGPSIRTSPARVRRVRNTPRSRLARATRCGGPNDIDGTRGAVYERVAHRSASPANSPVPAIRRRRIAPQPSARTGSGQEGRKWPGARPGRPGTSLSTRPTARPATAVEGSDPAQMHQQFAAALERCLDDITQIQRPARRDGITGRPRWPMIVLRSPKGWTGPKEIDSRKVEGSWRAHQVPFSNARGDDSHRAVLEQWMRSYRPEELFDATGAPVPEIRDLHPAGDRRM